MNENPGSADVLYLYRIELYNPMLKNNKYINVLNSL